MPVVPPVWGRHIKFKHATLCSNRYWVRRVRKQEGPSAPRVLAMPMICPGRKEAEYNPAKGSANIQELADEQSPQENLSWPAQNYAIGLIAGFGSGLCFLPPAAGANLRLS